jgi:hypothetical protein
MYNNPWLINYHITLLHMKVKKNENLDLDLF